MSVIGSQEFPF